MKSKVGKVQKNSKSVKTIIPQGIAGVLKVAEGDELDWEIVAEKDGRLIAKVRKVE